MKPRSIVTTAASALASVTFLTQRDRRSRGLTRSPRRRASAIALTLGLAAVSGCGAQVSNATSDKVGVVLCSAADWGTNYQLPVTYWKQMFASGTGGIADYFDQVSYGHISFNATVLGPIQVTNALGFYPESLSARLTLLQYMGLTRTNEIAACLTSAANAGQNLSGYQELIADQIDNTYLDQPPENYYPQNGTAPYVYGSVNSAGPVSGTTQHLSVTTFGTFPATPFPVQIGGNQVLVTSATPGQGGATNWTVTLSFQAPPSNTGPPPVSAGSGNFSFIPYTADAGALVGRNTITVGTGSSQQTVANVGTMTLSTWMDSTGVTQEIAHGMLNMNHTRDLATLRSYTDPWDPMSAYANDYYDTQQPAFAAAANFSQVQGGPYKSGPWFDAVDLDYNHWLPAIQEDTSLLTAQGCVTEGAYLGALSSGARSTAYLELRLPYTQTQRPGFPAGGLYYTAEYRDPRATSGSNPWDSGIKEPGVVLHLAVGYPSTAVEPYISYLADATVSGQLAFGNPGNLYGTMPLVAGSDFADAASHAYFAVNATPPGTADVTEGTCTVPTTLTAAPVSGHTGMLVTYMATLRTSPSQGPSFVIPGQQVNFTGPGSEDCQASTDANGVATCTDFLTESTSQLASQPFVTTSWGGDIVYQAATIENTFNFTNPPPSGSPSPHLSTLSG